MYRVELDKTVDKFLSKHKGESIIDQFEIAVHEIGNNPYQNNLDISILKGYEGKYRLRLGDYRFIYEVSDEEVLVYFLDAGTRGNIYKKYK